MRIYDERLGKFLSVDPITGKYSELTLYQFASNRPIDGIDMDGLEFVSDEARDAHFGRSSKANSGLFKTPNETASKPPSPASIKPSNSDNTFVVKQQASVVHNKLPDPIILRADLYGTGIMGKKSEVDAIVQSHSNQYYDAWGANIAGGFFGALGSHISGVNGSNVGASFDGITQSFGGITSPGSSSVLSRPNSSINGISSFAPIEANVNSSTTKLSPKQSSFKLVDQDQNVKIFSTIVNGSEIKFGGTFTNYGDFMVIDKLDIDAKLTNKLGITGINNLMSDFAKDQGVKQIDVNGANRTTGAKPGKKPSKLTFKPKKT